MKYRFCLLLLVVFLMRLNAQTINSTNFNIKPSPFNTENFGQSSHNIYYKFTFSDDPRSANKKEILGILQLGDKVSKFSDFNQLRMDSLNNKYSKREMIGTAEMKELFRIKILWHSVILKNGSRVTEQDRFRNAYQYEESFPTFEWKLEEGAKEILGYKCKKAAVQYRGRSYTAWYAPEIPIAEGPYKFGGLPGLILELEDTKQEFHFLAVALTKTPLPIYLRNEEQIFKISRKKFKEVEASYHQNPGFYHGTAYNSDGSVINVKSKPLPHNPIELE